MDPEAFTASLFKWDPRAMVQPQPNRLLEAVAAPLQPLPVISSNRPRDLCGLDFNELFQAYGVRYYTAVKIAELGFTVNTLVDMKDEELDDMMNSLCDVYQWELLVGERYGVKAAVRAERRRFEEEELARRRQMVSGHDTANAIDALSQEGLSEEPVQQEKEDAGSGGGAMWEVAAGGGRKMQQRLRKGRRKVVEVDREEVNGGGTYERQREHPFIVTEPGELARGKKNGLDYLFDLYKQCHDFLIEVQNIAKERGEKCPTKVTNQVFRYAKKAGATYINKPKMRHYVHCFALHCLDEDTSNALRKAFKERGENVGAWRQACYRPLVAIAARQGWDIDAIFTAHPRLAVWYVPTRLRKLCHAERSGNIADAVDHLNSRL